MGSASDDLAGLAGTQRREVAEGVWQAWRSSPKSGVVLIGASGIGKSDGVVAPLHKRAEDQGLHALLIEVPLPVNGVRPVDLEVDLLDRLLDAVDYAEIELTPEQRRRRGFFMVLRTLLKGGVLVVIDEFQRLLDSGGLPVPPFAEELAELADRRGKGGLWLVSNRTLDPTWTEPFHVATLPKPSVADAIGIVVDAIPTGHNPEKCFPVDRRSEIVERLGANPRVLRMLGSLLGGQMIDNLLGVAPDSMAEPDDPTLVNAIERRLLVKATEGLPDDGARKALADLSVLEDWAELGLRERMIDGHGDVGELTRTLLSRHLLEAHPTRTGSMSKAAHRVHPVLRELNLSRRHSDEASWRAAHRRAAEWYARPLLAKGLSQVGERQLATALDRTGRHLDKAGADALSAEVWERMAQYLAKYQWLPTVPRLAVDRDGRIALLSAYLAEIDDPSLHNHLAWNLYERKGPGDAVRALRHAERGTAGQVKSYPWNLWIKLVRRVNGLDAAVVAGREAAQHVREHLYRIYTATAGALAASGRPEEAVAELRRGCGRIPKGDRYRLAQHALFYAAGESDPTLLKEVRKWLRGLDGLEPQAILGDILVLQHQGKWADSTTIAHQATTGSVKLVHFFVCEAIGWLAEKRPADARRALRAAPNNSNRGMVREGREWLAALVELSANRPVEASAKLAEYLGGAAKVPTAANDIRAELLALWDTRLAVEGEFTPSFHLPILPPAITGLPGNAYRTQYGDPVLPQHRKEGPVPAEGSAPHLTILAVATEWYSAKGGLSTFNRQLCTALAALPGVQVFCTAPEATEQEQKKAAEVGVTLVRPAGAHSGSVQEAIARRPNLPPGVEPDVIIGHGRITGQAADSLLDHFRAARRLHFIHMAPDEIEWFKPGRDDIGLHAEQRQQEELDLGKGAHRVVAVGPRLFNRYVRDFSSDRTVSVVRMDPGFDVDDPIDRQAPPGEPWSILLFGRAEDAELKGLDIAARAVALAVRERGPNAAELELKVRGAPEKSSGPLREQLIEWADDPAMRPLVRSYSTDSVALANDLHTASLVLMPSRAEGFGLTGVEAIMAGTPVLVSEESGLGKLLQSVLGQEMSARCVVPVSGTLEADAIVWRDAIKATLRNREAAFTDAAEMRTLLMREKTWAVAVRTLLNDCDLR